MKLKNEYDHDATNLRTNVISTIEYPLAYFQENNCLDKLEDDQSRLHKNRNYFITNTRNYVTCILELRFKKQTNRETEQYKTHNGQAQKKKLHGLSHGIRFGLGLRKPIQKHPHVLHRQVSSKH